MRMAKTFLSVGIWVVLACVISGCTPAASQPQPTASTTTVPTEASTTTVPTEAPLPTRAPGTWYATALAEDAYAYPVTPLKTPEIWRTFVSHTQMQDAVAVPAEVLARISTPGLAETCMLYPLAADAFFFDYTYGGGMRGIEENNAALQELYSRPDAAQAMIRLYRTIDRDGMAADTSIFGRLQLGYVEYMLVNEQLIAQMTHPQRLQLLRAVLDKHPADQIKRSYGPTSDVSFFVLGRLLAADSLSFQNQVEQDTDLKIFLEMGFSVPLGTKEAVDLVALALRHLEQAAADAAP